MGTRYDFELTVSLREETPDDIIRMAAFMMGQGDEPPAEAPDDPFFDGDDWKKCRLSLWATDCEPHAGVAVCSFRRAYRYSRHGNEHFQYTLHLRFCGRLEVIIEVVLPFAMWLAKWSDQNEFVGYYKGEQSRHPKLLYIHDAELYMREVTESPQRATDGQFWK